MFLNENARSPRRPNPTARTNRWWATWRTVRGLDRRQWLYLPRLFNREERLRIFIAGGIAVVAIAVLTARIFTRITVEGPAVGGTFREGTLTEPRFLNPLYASTDTDRDLVNLVFSKLIRYDHEGKTAMDLAEGVEVSDDGKAYTVRLRSGVRWHNGADVSADDVVFTIKTIQDPEYQSPLRPNWQGVAVEKLNDLTVRFTLRQPYAPFIENLALGIIPEHLWRKIPREAAVLSDLNLKPVGTGPYRFRKLTRQEDGTITAVVLERNRSYHLRTPYIEELRFTFYPDETRLVAAYRRNDIDGFLLFSALELPAVQSLDVEIHELNLPKLFAVFLNPGAQPALGRPAVRRALALAIDRRAIIGDTVAGGGVEVNTPLPPGTFGHDSEIAGIPYDPDAARALLAKDGWDDADGDGVLERSEGSGRKKTTQKLEVRLVTSDAAELARAEERIAEMWRAIGVKVEAQTLAVGDLEATMIRPRAYEALLFGEVLGHDPDPFAFWHTSQLKDPGLNIALYSNATVDRLLEEARRTADPAERAKRYRQFQQLVAEEIGAIFLYSPTHFYVVRRNVRGVVLGSLALPDERFNGVNQWYIDTRRVFRSP
mgnify:CR=1 FL=1